MKANTLQRILDERYPKGTIKPEVTSKGVRFKWGAASLEIDCSQRGADQIASALEALFAFLDLYAKDLRKVDIEMAALTLGMTPRALAEKLGET